jgi:hypothetical protein
VSVNALYSTNRLSRTRFEDFIKELLQMKLEMSLSSISALVLLSAKALKFTVEAGVSKVRKL